MPRMQQDLKFQDGSPPPPFRGEIKYWTWDVNMLFFISKFAAPSLVEHHHIQRWIGSCLPPFFKKIHIEWKQKTVIHVWVSKFKCWVTFEMWCEPSWVEDLFQQSNIIARNLGFVWWMPQKSYVFLSLLISWNFCSESEITLGIIPHTGRMSQTQTSRV